MRCQCHLQVGVDDAGFDTGTTILGIDFEDLIQAGQVEQDAAGGGHHPARAIRRSAARHDGDLVFEGEPHDCSDVAAAMWTQ